MIDRSNVTLTNTGKDLHSMEIWNTILLQDTLKRRSKDNFTVTILAVIEQGLDFEGVPAKRYTNEASQYASEKGRELRTILE